MTYDTLLLPTFSFICAFLSCYRIPVLLNHLKETFVTHSWQCLWDNGCKSSCTFSSQIHGKLWKPVWKADVFSWTPFFLHTQASNTPTHDYCLHCEWGKGIIYWVCYFCLIYCTVNKTCVVMGKFFIFDFLNL